MKYAYFIEITIEILTLNQLAKYTYKMAARINYLNNRDIGREVHKSKNSYSSYVSDEYAQYDLIVSSLKKINPAAITQARKNRAARLCYDAWQASLADGRKTKQSEHEIKPRTIPKTDLIFRVMTWDHVPLAPGRKRVPKIKADYHVQVNFPPFQHWKFADDGQLVCVGKSHWVGGMENGMFSVTHGKLTNLLAKQFMLLCERYSRRANWRGYTYVDEMRSQALLQLSHVALQFNEAISDNYFGYYTQCITASFTRILNTEKRNQDIRDDILEMNSMNPSLSRQSKVQDDEE